jgi:hypothetical protein
VPAESRRTYKQHGGYIVLVSDLSAHRAKHASHPLFAAKQDTIRICYLRCTLTAKICARLGPQEKICK